MENGGIINLANTVAELANTVAEDLKKRLPNQRKTRASKSVRSLEKTWKNGLWSMESIRNQVKLSKINEVS